MPVKLSAYHLESLTDPKTRECRPINTSVTLNKRNGTWWLSLCYDTVIPIKTQPDAPVVGIDVDIANFLTTSTGKRYGSFHKKLRERHKRDRAKRRCKAKLRACLKQIQRHQVKGSLLAERDCLRASLCCQHTESCPGKSLAQPRSLHRLIFDDEYGLGRFFWRRELIRPVFSLFGDDVRHPWEDHEEDTALSRGTRHADRATLGLDDAFGESKTQTGSLVLFSRAAIKLLKFDKEAIQVLRFDQPIVQHFREADDAVERGPQFVGHVGEKFTFETTGSLDEAVLFFQFLVLELPGRSGACNCLARCAGTLAAQAFVPRYRIALGRRRKIRELLCVHC